MEDYAAELLDGTTVTEGNMLQYLAIIEKKTNEILQMHHFSQNKGEGNKTGQEDKKRGNEESNLSGTTQFPEKDLLSKSFEKYR